MNNRDLARSMTDTVSIIIINYNYRDYLAYAIESALNQSISSIEVIVVDDGSDDGSDEVLRSYRSRVRIIKQENSGACFARNSGLRAAQGRYVKFLDADDWLLPDALEIQVELAERMLPIKQFAITGDPIWCYGDTDVDRNAVPFASAGDLKEIPLEAIIQSAPLTSSPLHLRDEVLNVGGFDERVMRGQEHDLHVRLALNGVRFFYHPTPVYCYRQHNSSNRISRWDKPKVAWSMYQASERRLALAYQLLTTPLPASVRQAFAKRIWREGRECLQRGARSQAEKMFELARKTYPTDPIFGSTIYRKLARVLGPRISEDLSKATSFAGKLKRRN